MKWEKKPPISTGPVTIPLRAGISFASHKLFSGANCYHGSTVITYQLDLGILAGVMTAELPTVFADTFLKRFQSMPSFLPDNGISESFRVALQSTTGVDLAQVMLEAILAVEHSVLFAQHDLNSISFAAINRDGDLPLLIWETSRPEVSGRSAEIALVGLNEILDQKTSDKISDDENNFASMLESLRDKVKRKRLAPSTAAIRLEAAKRGIPCQTLRRQHLLLGEGHMQHHFYASMTDSTSMAAQKVCADKRQTNRRLTDLRLPTPRQFKVGTHAAALEAANKIGFPVVVKPVRGKKGRDISVGINRPQGIKDAFDLAHRSGADVVIEDFVPGLDYRLLVIGGQFVAAVHRKPPVITGNGQATVSELIDIENENPYRDGFRGFCIEKDEEVLRHLHTAGLKMDDVLAEGKQIRLRTAANVSIGGVPIDVTDQVHPDNRAMAERAAIGVGLDVAGIDYISADISVPYHEIGGAIVEINARPGLDIHIWPVAGKSRDVARILLEQTFPRPHTGRLPVAIICGDRGTGTVARALEQVLRGANRSVALTLRNDFYAGGVRASWPRRQQSQAQRILLRDPAIDTMVSTVSLRQTGESGLNLERASVSVIMDRVKPGRASLFHLGMDVVARATSDCIITSAGNLLALERLATNQGKQLILVSDRINDPGLQTHLGNNGLAVSMQWQEGENQVVLLSGEDVLARFSMKQMYHRNSATKQQQFESAFRYAIAASYALGLTPDNIAMSLASDVEMIDA